LGRRFPYENTGESSPNRRLTDYTAGPGTPFYRQAGVAFGRHYDHRRGSVGRAGHIGLAGYLDGGEYPELGLHEVDTGGHDSIPRLIVDPREAFFTQAS